MVSTRGQNKRTNIVYSEDSDVSDNESEYSYESKSTIDSENSSDSENSVYSSTDSESTTSSESSYSEVKMTRRWKDDNVGSLVSEQYDSDDLDDEDDPDYEYESESESDDEYDSEFEDLMELHTQLKKWKEKHDISYDDALLIHSLVMIRHSR